MLLVALFGERIVRIDYNKMARGTKLCVHMSFEVSEALRVAVDITNSFELTTLYFESRKYQPKRTGRYSYASVADLGYEVNMDGGDHWSPTVVHRASPIKRQDYS